MVPCIGILKIYLQNVNSKHLCSAADLVLSEVEEKYLQYNEMEGKRK